MLALGESIDRYRIERPLGAGGMAQVYLARHTGLGTLHALKVLTATSPTVRPRLLQEGRVQASVRHRNLVPVTDLVEHAGSPVLVMDFVPGPTLAELLADAGALPVATADVLARGVMAGVAHAHASGLVHRDLKPANVLLDVAEDRLVPRVADFGIAKVLADGPDALTRTGVVVGTPVYMAPEQMSDAKRVDERADVYSLGVMLYEMVTGHRPFEATGAGVSGLIALHRQIVAGDYRAPRACVPHLPERMDAAIRAALVADPAERCPDVPTLVALWTDGTPEPDAAFPHALLRPAVERTPPSPTDQATTWLPDATIAEPAPQPRRTGHRWAVAAVAGLAVVGGGAFLASGDADPPLRSRTLATVPGLAGATSTIARDGRDLLVLWSDRLERHPVDGGVVRTQPIPDGAFALDLSPLDDGSVWITAIREGRRVALHLDGDGALLAERALPEGTEGLAVAPPGGPVAFVTGEAIAVAETWDAPPEVLVRSGTGESVASYHFWRPDGAQLGQLAIGGDQPPRLDVFDVHDGTRTRLVSDADLFPGRAGLAAAWRTDDRLVFGLGRSASDDSTTLYEIDPAAPEARRPLHDLSRTVGIRLTAAADGRRLGVHTMRVRRTLDLAGWDAAAGGLAGEPEAQTDGHFVAWPCGWTADGSLLYRSNRTGESALYLRRPGEDAAVVPGVTGGGRCGEPVADGILSWRDDGDDGALVRTAPGAAVLLAAPATQTPTIEVRCAPIAEPACVVSRPDGAELVFARLDSTTGATHPTGARLVTTPREWALTRDGARVAIGRYPEPGVDVVDLADGAVTAVDTLVRVQHLAWTPDGTGLVASGFGHLPRAPESPDRAERPLPRFTLAHVAVDGGTTTLLRGREDAWMGGPVLSPDGHHLAFTTWATDEEAHAIALEAL